MLHYLPVLSTLVTFIFAYAVLARWRYKKPRHLLFWGLGLVLYGLGTLSEVVLAFTFNELVLKLWYLSGAMLTAAWLGQGTVYLLVRKARLADALAGVLLAASLLSLGLVLAAPLTGAQAGYDLARPVSLQYKDILVRSGPVTLLTILLNIYGTLGLVGGALYSAFLFWRKSILANRMLGNLLIAGGALLPAMAGSLVKAGLVDWLYASELLGSALMFAGFMLATSGKPAVQRAASAPAD
ncbi:MAG: hypothetical protein ACKOC5_13690 [Chloroflexota bacterium]